MRSTTSRLALCAAAVLGVVCASAGSVQAQSGCEDLANNEAYERITTEGAELARAERHDEALEKFREAQAVCPYDPTITYYIARTRQLQGKCEAAIELYVQAQTQLDSGLVPTPGALGDAIAERLEETRTSCAPPVPGTGTLRVVCAEAGVALSLAGGAPVACPAELAPAPGTWVLSATREGAEPYVTTLEVVAGESRELSVPPLMALPGMADPIAEGPATAAPDDDDSLMIAGWATLGTGVALAATGTALHFVAQGQVDEISESMTQVEAQAQQDDAETLNVVSATLIGLGGAAVATGAVLVVLEALDEESPVAASAAPLADGGALLVLGARF